MYTEEELDKANIEEEFLALPDTERQKAIDELPVYHKRVILATLGGEEHTSTVFAAFAVLANALSSEWGAQTPEPYIKVIMTGHDIRRPSTRREMIEHVIHQIWVDRYNANTKERQAAEMQQAKRDLQATLRGDDQWKATSDPVAADASGPLA